MTHTFKFLISAATCAMLVSGSALANPDADLDQDGKISQTEFIDAANKRFLESDLNGDQIVTADERENHRNLMHSKHQEKRFDTIDANGDGFITRDEFASFSDEHKERRQARRDFNDDGEIDRADRRARREKMKERWEKRAERHEGREHRRFHPDANQDGAISWEEHQAATQKLFERLDRNEDGFLEEGEGRRHRMMRHFGRH